MQATSQLVARRSALLHCRLLHEGMPGLCFTALFSSDQVDGKCRHGNHGGFQQKYDGTTTHNVLLVRSVRTGRLLLRCIVRHRY